MKNVLTPLLAGLLLLAGAAHASTAASSASDSASSTTSSASDSIGDSSRSSSGGQKVAAGEYRVLTVAQGPRAGTVQARLRNDEGAEFSLVLPQDAATKGGLVADARVRVSVQDYGYAFARADNREVFFLALEDNRALQSRAL